MAKDVDVDRLRTAATRLAAELDAARQFRAAAFVSMAADAMGPVAEAAVNDNRPQGDVLCEFELDEHGRVWMIRDGDCHIIGRKGPVAREMWRFLRAMISSRF